MNDFLSKPIKRQELDHILAQWLPRDRQQYSGTITETGSANRERI
jgi:FixJ family two-component response regulator